MNRSKMRHLVGRLLEISLLPDNSSYGRNNIFGISRAITIQGLFRLMIVGVTLDAQMRQPAVPSLGPPSKLASQTISVLLDLASTDLI